MDREWRPLWHDNSVEEKIVLLFVFVWCCWWWWWLALSFAHLSLPCGHVPFHLDKVTVSDAHLVDEGWQVFFVRQTSIIPPSWPSIQTRHQELYERCSSWRPCALDDDWCHGSCSVRRSRGQWPRRSFSGIWWAICLVSQVVLMEPPLFWWPSTST